MSFNKQSKASGRHMGYANKTQVRRWIPEWPQAVRFALPSAALLLAMIAAAALQGQHLSPDSKSMGTLLSFYAQGSFYKTQPPNISPTGGVVGWYNGSCELGE